MGIERMRHGEIAKLVMRRMGKRRCRKRSYRNKGQVTPTIPLSKRNFVKAW